ncbi:hypothetical protein ACFLTI_08735 [Bacteroidota bacterium]
MKKTLSFNKVLILLIVTAITVSCGIFKKTSKTNFAGNYEWVIEGMPQGDQNGTVTFIITENGYKGEISVDGMEIAIEKIKLEGNKLTGSIYPPGEDVDVSLSIVFEGNIFKGNISVMDEMSFPFNGKKIK